MGSRRTNNIEVLSERLGSLQINEETSTEEYKRTDTKMSVVPAAAAASENAQAVVPAAAAASENAQAGVPKSMVPDLGWFDGDRSKFED